MLNHFTFNGHSTGELGLLVSGINIYGSPSRVVEKVNIPYRSGDLLIDTGAYTNYMLTYTVDIMDNTKATAEAISKWLLGSKGYCELTDTYNPEIYRVASYYNQLDYTLSALYRYGKATITFDCKPQKYLTANQPVSLSSTLSEETSYSLSTPAMPLPITLEGNTTQGANPTPSSPQTIHSVSGDNEIRVTGKNLLLNSDSFEGWEINNSTNISVENGIVTFNPQSKAWWSVEANKNMLRYSDINNPISVSVDLRSDANGALNNGTVYVILAAFNSEGVRVGRYNIFILSSISGTWDRYIKSNISKSSISPIDSYTRADIENGYVGIQIYNNSLSNLQVTHPQLEVGSTATVYEPYKAQVYPINLGSIELNALGNYKDYFYKSDGKWYLHKAIQKIDVGTLTWARRATNIFGSNLPNGTDVTADISAHMSNYFPIQYVTGVVNTQINTIAIYKTSNITLTTSVYVSLADIDTVGDLTTWFNSHATELYYPLATPTNTEITDETLISQLNALSKAKTYDGSTTIMQEGTDAQFKLSMPVPTEISSEYFGEPIITVNEVGTIVWNDSLIKVNSAPVTINSQTLQCYYYSENKNNDVEVNEFPKYEQDENYIGSTMALTVVPNYWKL